MHLSTIPNSKILKERSPNWTKTQTRTQRPKGPFGSLRVPIGPNCWHGPGTP